MVKLLPAAAFHIAECAVNKDVAVGICRDRAAVGKGDSQPHGGELFLVRLEKTRIGYIGVALQQCGNIRNLCRIIYRTFISAAVG